MKGKMLSLLAGAAMLGSVGVASAAEPLSDELMDKVTAGVSLTGGSSLAFTGGIGTSTFSSANATSSSTSANNGGTVGAASLTSFVLAASPPGS